MDLFESRHFSQSGQDTMNTITRYFGVNSLNGEPCGKKHENRQSERYRNARPGTKFLWWYQVFGIVRSDIGNIYSEINRLKLDKAEPKVIL